MPQEIVKQLDASDISGVSDDLVGFVEAQDHDYADGHIQWVYFASVYQRPVGYQKPLASCGHEHREQHAAERCLRRLLRKTTLVGKIQKAIEKNDHE